MKIAVMDIETTDLDIRKGSICEIGIVLLDLENGNIETIFNNICREDNIEITPNSWVFKNSSLTYTNVIESLSFEYYKKELQEIFNIYHTTSYSNFDFKFMKSRGLLFPKLFWDPMKKLTLIMKLPYNAYKYHYPSVVEAYEYFFNESINEEHRAIDDAIIEAKIIYKLYKQLEAKYKEVLL